MAGLAPLLLSLLPALVIAMLVLAGLVLVGALWGGMTPALLAAAVLAALASAVAAHALPRARRSEARLRQTLRDQLRLRAMALGSRDAFVLLAPQGDLLQVVRLSDWLQSGPLGSVADILAALRDADRLPLEQAVFRLQQEGEDFTLTVQQPAAATHAERRFVVAGTRVVLGQPGPIIDVLHWRDDSASQQQQQALQTLLDQQQAEIQQWQQALDALPVPLWLRGSGGALRWVNRAYAEIVDQPARSVVSSQKELTDTVRADSAREMARLVQTTGAAQQLDRHVIVHGARHLLQIHEIPLLTALRAGSPMQGVGLALDISRQEELQRELERHITAHADVLEQLSTGISIFGPDQKLLFYNRALIRLWEYDERFLESRPSLSDVIDDLRSRRKLPEQVDFQRYKRARLDLFTTLIEPREELMHLPDGMTARVLMVPHPFGGVMFVYEDVTDRLALESSYNTLIAVQRETLDNLAEGIAVFGPDARLQLYNPAFCRIWQLSPAELGSRPHLSEVLELMRPLWRYAGEWPAHRNMVIGQILERVARAGRQERTDGSVVEFTTVPLPDGAVLASFLDVSDSMRVEQALRASNAALAAADRLKSEFVANVSYQLRTPLNTIMGFAEILTNQYFGTLNERQLEYARTIMDASKRLLLLINDVLDLATIEAGRMALQRRTVAVAPLLRETVAMLTDAAAAQELELVVSISDALGTIEADENRLRQVVHNLLQNAIQYTPAEGRVQLLARRLEESVEIEVADTGIGIPPVDQERIFGKFERSNLGHRVAGAGLGLSLVKSFVELHGGQVRVESRIGRGTRIVCSLPIQPPAIISPHSDPLLPADPALPPR